VKAAGGGTDTIARTLVKNAKKYFGVNVNVVNKTGGLGAVGMGSVATAAPDGYTAGVITFHLSNYRMMGLANLSYKDYSLIQLINREGAAASVAFNSKFQTLKDLIEFAKKNPGVVTAGHAGAGSVQHLSLASLGLREKVKFVHVPFDGSAPARTAVRPNDHPNTRKDSGPEFLKAWLPPKAGTMPVPAEPWFPC